MRYIYPKLSSKDLFLFRLGGSGLGNILFTYARAVSYAKKHTDCKLIWPTWPSLKIGTILRNEKDKRFYIGLFKNNLKYICGIKKAYLLLKYKHISEEKLLSDPSQDNCIVDFVGMEGCFADIMGDSALIKEDIIRNLNKKQLKALSFDGSKAVCMHIRLGDFYRVSIEEVKNGKHCSAIPIEWYVKMGKEIRRIVGNDVKIYVFSDGTDEELKPVLDLPNTERYTTGSAIGDILALSTAGVFVASGSSFSMWARYLGRMTTVMFPNQVKQEILQEDDKYSEIVASENIEEAFFDEIKNVLL